jgi:hypothetical protein
MMGWLPAEELCNYNMVFYERNALLSPSGVFNTALLDMAQWCGTQVIVRLPGVTADIAATNGGLDLVNYEDKLNDFVGLIEPYIENGTIVGHLTIDEPHDCSDWNDVCPHQSVVDQAAALSHSYWPSLATMVNTVPFYAQEYAWVYMDNVLFTYAYHKGLLSEFVQDSVAVLENGLARQISWAIQAKSGGCSVFGQCSMTPEQVKEVGTAMCDTLAGEVIGFYKYEVELIDSAMQASINDIRSHCGDVINAPAKSFSSWPGQRQP